MNGQNRPLIKPKRRLVGVFTLRYVTLRYGNYSHLYSTFIRTTATQTGRSLLGRSEYMRDVDYCDR